MISRSTPRLNIPRASSDTFSASSTSNSIVADTNLWYHSVYSRKFTMTNTTVKQFTIRIPGHLYDQARRLARRQGTSLNQLAASGLSELTRQDGEKQLRDAYERLAVDSAEMDVESFIAAQAEVVNDDAP